jgi:ferrochelatase
LETLEEISVENAAYFKEAGGESLRLIPCLNASDIHIAMMCDILKPYCELAGVTKRD